LFSPRETSMLCDSAYTGRLAECKHNAGQHCSRGAAEGQPLIDDGDKGTRGPFIAPGSSSPGGLAVGGGLRDSPHLPACHEVARGWPFPTKTSGPGDGLLRVSLTIQACNWWPPARTTAVFQRECSVVPSLTHVGQISGREADGLTLLSLLSPTPGTSPLPHHTSLHHRHRHRTLSATTLANVCHSTGPQLTSPCSKHRLDLGILRPCDADHPAGGPGGTRLAVTTRLAVCRCGR
jgi:hypothetical protein